LDATTLLHILMIFGDNFDPYSVLLAIPTNTPVRHVIQGDISCY